MRSEYYCTNMYRILRELREYPYTLHSISHMNDVVCNAKQVAENF